MLDVASFHSGLDTAVAAETFSVPACPVDGVLISVVDPVLVVFEYQHHATCTMRG